MNIQKTENINIQNFLPHRAPMLMVDQVLSINKNEVLTSFCISEDNIFLEDGFLAAAGIIENIAQTSSAITGQEIFIDAEETSTTKNPEVIGFITNLKKIKIYDLPPIGSQILSKATLHSQFGDVCTISCKTFLEDQLMADAEISLLIKVL